MTTDHSPSTAVANTGGSPTVEVTDISKHFGGIVALEGINLSLSAGEVVALVGDNGAGKSTLAKIVAGVIAQDEGQVYVEGRPVRIAGPMDARELGIEVVYQDLALAPNLDVVSNLFLGRERTRLGIIGWLDRRAMIRSSRQLLEELDVVIPSYSTKVERLSGGQRQAIAVARASHWGRRLVIMDEPTAALGVRETAKAEELILNLKEKGLAVLIVSHDLGQVFRVSDRVVVLRRGRKVAEYFTADTHVDEVVAMITGAR